MDGPARWERMAARIDRTARAAGIDAEGRRLVGAAFRVAMVPRLAVIDDDHHPDYLHAGRTAIVLLDDVALFEPVALAAACLLDTRRPELEASDEEVAAAVGGEVLAFRSMVPRAGSERLLEDLLAQERAVVLVALAERLDHLRHAHLWGAAGEAREAHEEASRVYVPMAERAHAVLARRYRHWCRIFAEKLAT